MTRRSGRRPIDSMSALEMAKTLSASELRELSRTGGAPLADYKDARALERSGRIPVDASEEERRDVAREGRELQAEHEREEAR